MRASFETELLRARQSASFSVKAAVIDVVTGPDAGRSIRLDGTALTVGTGPDADLQLTDPGVSRRHLRFTVSPEGLAVRDEGSTNGTWLGDVRISSVLLTADTAIEIGGSTLLIRLSGADLELPISEQENFGDAIGISPMMRHVFALLERASRSDIPVLLEGESGTGKGALARALHERSDRSSRPFVSIDCGAIPASLIESELFGSEQGAFTGAESSRKGLFVQAEGGTVFLDEIGELPLELQPKLLKVIEDREVRPLGAHDIPRRVDVRIIAATNRNLGEASNRNEFRRDLFYRLAVARVTLPPLRDRREDVLPLAQRFLRDVLSDPRAELPRDLSAMLSSYDWPGNVRELRNVIQRYALLEMRSAAELFDRDPAQDREPIEDLSTYPYREARQRALVQFERIYLSALLERAGGVVAKAAVLAQVARPSFYRMLDRSRSHRARA